jgi:transcriptional regulator of acetoin/glycerol metabolism
LQNFHLQNRRPVPVTAAALGAPGSNRVPVLPLAQLEKEAILETLRKLNGDKLLAARLLGIGKTTLYRKLKEYGIGAPDAEEHASNEDSAAHGL